MSRYFSRDTVSADSSDSLVVTHEYAPSREAILPLFDAALQSQRSMPEANATDLFARLHGMLFTKIDLDNFPSVMSRYMERLEEDAQLNRVTGKSTISQVDWMIMGSVNLASLLQYGSMSGVIRKALVNRRTGTAESTCCRGRG